MRSILVVATSVIVVLAAPIPVAAQTPSTRPSPEAATVFVTGAIFADVDEMDFTPAGPALAGGVGIGLSLSPGYDLRAEFQIPGWHSEEDSSNGSVAALEHRFSTRTRSLAVMLARRSASDIR